MEQFSKMYDNPAGLSFHADVFSAQPANDESRGRLIEEIKTRAKSSIKTSNYYDATKLYTKAIDTALEKDSKHELSTKKDIAILYANKSMCELQMKQLSSALHDAEEAIRYDPTYVKGYYRKAMVLIEKHDYGLAKEALLAGLAIQADEKDFLTQLRKVDELIVKNGTQPNDTSVKTWPSSSSSSNSSNTTKSTVTKSTNNSNSSNSNPSSATTVTTATNNTSDKMTEDEEEEKLALARGYRKTADGRVTTFFHHDLDDHTKSLIGDIAPKKLEVVDSSVAIATNDSSSTSVWNSAGTYEERIFTPYATDRLKELLLSLYSTTTLSSSSSTELSSPLGQIITLTKEISSIKGDAQISMLRGKRKHIYDFSMELAIYSTIGTVTVLEGTINIEDITADMEQEMTIVLKPIVTSTNTTMISNDDIKTMKKNIQSDINKLLLSFNQEFKQK